MTTRAKRPSPGVFIKEYLAAHGTASIQELHGAYKERIDEVNAGRERHTRLNKPVYSSFYTYLRHLVTLGLVEKVGEEPTEDIESPGQMGFVERGPQGQLRVHKGTVRRLMSLTAKGSAATTEWEDPVRALNPRYRS